MNPTFLTRQIIVIYIKRLGIKTTTLITYETKEVKETSQHNLGYKFDN